MVNEQRVGEVLQDLFASFAEAEAHRRLPGFIDDCMFELQEKDPGLAALFQHMLAQVKEDCDADQAGHLLFVLAYSTFKAQNHGTPPSE